MSNLDNIINEILQDAEKESKQIKENANQESKALVEKSKQEANKVSEKIIEKAKSEAEQIKDKVISNAKLNSRDKVLVAKQKMIDKVFDMANEKLENLEHDRYLLFIEESIKKFDINESSEILLTNKEKNLTNGT